jgi:hypothetical protein
MKKSIMILMALSVTILVILLPVACALGETTTITETQTQTTTQTVPGPTTTQTVAGPTVTQTLEVPGPTKTVTQTATNPPATNPVTEPPSVAELRALGFSHPEMPRITAEQLKLLMDEGWVIPDDFVLVDTQAGASFQGGARSYHIWGCTTYITIQWSSGVPILSQTVLWQFRNLPKDKLIIFYDHGEKDESAASVAQVLLDLNEGYDPKNIKVLWQGFNRWRELGYPYYDPEKAGCS